MLDKEAIISQSFETSLNFKTVMAACAQPDERKVLVLDSHPSQSHSSAGFGSLSQEYNSSHRSAPNYESLNNYQVNSNNFGGYKSSNFREKKEKAGFHTIVVKDLMFPIQVQEFLALQNLISIPVLSIPLRFQLVKFATKEVMLQQIIFKGITIQPLTSYFNVKFVGSLDI